MTAYDKQQLKSIRPAELRVKHDWLTVRHILRPDNGGVLYLLDRPRRMQIVFAHWRSTLESSVHSLN